jgi:tyrosine-protein kinase Etk/Wzc
MTENNPPITATAPMPFNSGSDLQSMSVDDDEISILDLLQVVVDNLRLLVLGPIVAGLLALGYGFIIAPTFTATTKFLLPGQQQTGAAQMLQSLGALGGLASGTKNPADQYIAFLKSNTLKDALIERFKSMEPFATKSREDARNAISISVQIASGKDGLITIDASDKDPAFAAQLANAHVEELGKLLNRLAVTEAQQRRVFFEKQVSNAKDNLVKSEQALAASGVNSAVLKSTGAAITAVAQLKAQIVGQEIKLATMRGYLSESAPDFKQARTELTALHAQLAITEKTEPVKGAASSGGDYIAKLRDFKYNETLFEFFIKQHELARIDESREGAVIQVLDVAEPPERKVKPKKAQMAMITSLATGFALLLFVFIRKAMRSASSNEHSAARLAALKAALNKAVGRV